MRKVIVWEPVRCHLPLSKNKDLIKNSACDSRDVSNKSVLQHSRVISVVERHKMIILLRSPSVTRSLRQLWNVSTVRVSPRWWTNVRSWRLNFKSSFSLNNKAQICLARPIFQANTRLIHQKHMVPISPLTSPSVFLLNCYFKAQAINLSGGLTV